MFTVLLMLSILTLPQLAYRAITQGRSQPRLAAWAAHGAGLLFLLTASAHFTQTGAMVQMLPAWVPAREALVHATGILEIAIALFSPRWRRLGGWAAVAVLIGFFPANIHAALQHAPMGGHAWGPVYLLIRAPLQVLILAWIWVWVLRTPREQRAA